MPVLRAKGPIHNQQGAVRDGRRSVPANPDAAGGFRRQRPEHRRLRRRDAHRRRDGRRPRSSNPGCSATTSSSRTPNRLTSTSSRAKIESVSSRKRWSWATAPTRRHEHRHSRPRLDARPRRRGNHDLPSTHGHRRAGVRLDGPRGPTEPFVSIVEARQDSDSVGRRPAEVDLGSELGATFRRGTDGVATDLRALELPTEEISVSSPGPNSN